MSQNCKNLPVASSKIDAKIRPLQQTVSLLFGGLLIAMSACEGSPAEGSEGTIDDALSLRPARLKPLGENLNSESHAVTGGPALVAAPGIQPVLAFSTLDSESLLSKTKILRWSGNQWTSLGGNATPPLDAAGPALALDSKHRLYLCTGEGGPFVKRWNGQEFASLGGDISEEAGYKGFRYSVSGCDAMVLYAGDVPIIVWSAHQGPKADFIYVARWQEETQRWQGLGIDGIGVRATRASLSLDAQGRPYVTSYTPGGSYGGDATTRVWRWDGSAWLKLGADLPNTDGPIIAHRDTKIFLVLHDNGTNRIEVMRWNGTAWRNLSSPGSGNEPALDFSTSGKMTLAYVDAENSSLIRVKYLVHDLWHEIGTKVAESSPQATSVSLRIDAVGRPVLAWLTTDTAGNATGVFAARYNAPIP